MIAAMTWHIDIPEEPGLAERQAVLGPLAEFNERNGYPSDSKSVAVLIRDGDGAVVGGLWGRTGYGWLFVEFLVVPDSLRGLGLGTRLMEAAEGIARERGCVGAWLTTFPFQARGFYEKLGYSLFGTLEDYPPGGRRYSLSKRL
jgi:GNAT superfamily N-acetyltransferase